jgi:hypothetical protein
MCRRSWGGGGKDQLKLLEERIGLALFRFQLLQSLVCHIQRVLEVLNLLMHVAGCRGSGVSGGT